MGIKLRSIKPTLKANIAPIITIGAFWLAASFIAGTPCIVAAFTGLPCPACGMTRASLALIRGDFAKSLQMHPLLLPAIAVIALGFVRNASMQRAVKIAQLIFIVILLATYVIRMFILFPDNEPMKINRNSIVLRIFDFFSFFPINI